MARKRKVSVGKVNTEEVTVDEARSIVIKNKEIEGLSGQTIRNYRKLFKHLTEFMALSEYEHMRELSERDAKDFVYHLIEKGQQNNTINKYISIAKGAFKILEAEEVCQHIFKNTRYLKKTEKPINILTPEEIGAILNALDRTKYTEFRDYVLIHVLIDCFSRIGETLSLQVSDVDFGSQTITFEKTKSRRIRTVPISRKTAKLLKMLIEEVAEFNSDYIFLSWNGKPLELSGHEISNKMKTYAARVGITKRVYPHIFRHSASAHFIKETGNIRVLQKILGHSDISITQRYAHVLDATVHDMHDKYSIINHLESGGRRKTRINS